MFGMNVMAWNGGDLEKFEVLQNRVGRVALGAPKWTAAEALRGDLGWSLFSERMIKSVLNYKVRIERMENKSDIWWRTETWHCLHNEIADQQQSLRNRAPSHIVSVTCKASMKRSLVVGCNMTEAGVKRQCCRHDSIKQEAAAEIVEHVDIQNPKNPPEAMTIKNEVPVDEPDNIKVKEEPIDWNQELQVSLGAVSSTLTLKREREEDVVCAEAYLEHTLREGRSGSLEVQSEKTGSGAALVVDELLDSIPHLLDPYPEKLQRQSVTRKMMSKVRKWNDSYVKFGFTNVSRDGVDCAQCLHCSVVMANASLRPSKLSNHRDKIHPQRKDDNVEALSVKRARYDRQAPHLKFGLRPEDKPALQSSYEVAYRIAKCKMPHTIAEDLIKPCTEKIVELLVGPAAKKRIQIVSLSNDTIRRRINDMAADVCRQVCSEIKQSSLQASLQLDEFTDTALESQLIAFARYEKERKIKEEFLFCNTLPTTTTAADVKAIVDSFFEANELGWQNFKHICTDGASAILGVRGGFVKLVKNEWSHVTSSHCLLHRYALASMTLPPRLLEVMDIAVKVVDFIRAKAKNIRLFQLLANEMGEQHVGLLFNTEVRWLSRGRCLSRLYELRVEVEIFLRVNGNNLHVHFNNDEFVIILAYLGDIFGRFNEMNQYLQGRDVTVSDVQDKLAGLCARMGVWQAQIKAGSTASFRLLNEHLQTQMIELPVSIKDCITGHLDSLSAEFECYFDDNPLDVPWHRDPLNAEIEPTENEAEELAEFKVSKAMKLAFNNREDLSSFWWSVHDAYPLLSKKASVMLIQFATTYLCESVFSELATAKAKSRSSLDVGNDIRLAVSKTEPDIRGLVTRSIVSIV
ncbi:HAT C-terminal dimerization domain [Trinorchestia longiramus]|nr:HAT C-terminal dimerization domain [Trinorchestia longiramus]